MLGAVQVLLGVSGVPVLIAMYLSLVLLFILLSTQALLVSWFSIAMCELLLGLWGFPRLGGRTCSVKNVRQK